MVCIQAGSGIRPQANRPSGGFRRAPPAVGRLRRPARSLKFRPFPGVRSAPLIPKGRPPSAGEQKGQAYGRRPTALRAVSGGLRPPSAACGGRACGPPAPQIPLISRQTVCSPHPQRAPVLGRGAERAGIRPQANRPPGGFRRASPAVGRLRRPGLRPASLPSNSTRFPADGPPSPPGTGKASPCTNANRPRGSYPQAPPGNRQVGLVKIVAALYLLVVLLALPGQD